MKEVCEQCEPVCEECPEAPEVLGMVDGSDEEAPSLPPGIKTEAVLMYLGNVSQALQGLCNGINSTISQIVSEGSNQMEPIEGDEN